MSYSYRIVTVDLDPSSAVRAAEALSEQGASGWRLAHLLPDGVAVLERAQSGPPPSPERAEASAGVPAGPRPPTGVPSLDEVVAACGEPNAKGNYSARLPWLAGKLGLSGAEALRGQLEAQGVVFAAADGGRPKMKYHRHLMIWMGEFNGQHYFHAKPRRPAGEAPRPRSPAAVAAEEEVPM